MPSPSNRPGRLARAVLLILGGAIASGCALPRGGPQKGDILAEAPYLAGAAVIVAVDRRVARLASETPALGFSSAFLSAGTLGPDTIRPGDTLGLRIFENVEQGLLAPAGSPGTVLEAVQVDGDGFVFVPFAGRIRAAGTTPEGLREIVTDRLAAQTPDPQVLVTRLAGNGATVSVAGGVGTQGVYPIDRASRTLSAMLATAGGVAVPPDIARVTVVRAGQSGTVWFRDLYADPRLDIALRPGDRILVEADARAFSVLGAAGSQTRIAFQSQDLSVVEAVAQVGGLNPNLADPAGVFVLRTEPEATARQVAGRSDLAGPQQVVYALDFTTPGGLFVARDFAIRDDDLIYVTEAPFTRVQKVLSSVTGTLTPVANVATLAQ